MATLPNRIDPIATYRAARMQLVISIADQAELISSAGTSARLSDAVHLEMLINAEKQLFGLEWPYDLTVQRAQVARKTAPAAMGLTGWDPSELVRAKLQYDLFIPGSF